MDQVAAAVPDGSGLPSSTAAWMSEVKRRARDAGRRSDWVISLVAVAAQLAYAVDRETWTTRPTWAAICDSGGVGWSTVAARLRDLYAMGLLGRVATGKGAHQRWRAGQEAQNLAAVYVLAMPAVVVPVDTSRTPTRKSPTGPPLSTARGADARTDALRARPSQAPTAPPEPVKGEVAPAAPVRRTRRAARMERWAVAAALSGRVPALRGSSVRWIASVVRLHVAAGWSAKDLHYAIDHHPSGQPWTLTDDVAQPVGWLAWRLVEWIGTDGSPLPSRSQLAQERAVAAARRTRDQLAARRRAEQANAPSSSGPALVRAALAEARAARWRA